MRQFLCHSAGSSQRTRSGHLGRFGKHLLNVSRMTGDHGDIDLQRAREPMKAMRRGDWTADEVRNWVMETKKAPETTYVNCKYPERPPKEPLRQFLLDCLDE